MKHGSSTCMTEEPERLHSGLARKGLSGLVIGIDAIPSVFGELLIIAPHVGVVVIKLREQVVEFRRVLRFHSPRHPVFQEIGEGLRFPDSGEEP